MKKTPGSRCCARIGIFKKLHDCVDLGRRRNKTCRSQVAPCCKIYLVFCFARCLRTLSGVEGLVLCILSQRFSSTAGGLWPVPKRFSLGCFSLDLIKPKFPAVCAATVLFFHVQAHGSTTGRIRRSWSRSHIQQFETH